MDPEPAEETAELVRKNGGRAAIAVENTVELEGAQRMVETAIKEFGITDPQVQARLVA